MKNSACAKQAGRWQRPLHGYLSEGNHWQRSQKKQATLTGLEPATTGSTVRYSNQLSYSALFGP
jgi:hypothetical protein